MPPADMTLTGGIWLILGGKIDRRSYSAKLWRFGLNPLSDFYHFIGGLELNLSHGLYRPGPAAQQFVSQSHLGSLSTS